MNKLNRKILMTLGIGCTLACTSGCASLIMSAFGFKSATREEMMAELKPSFPEPAALTFTTALPKEKLIGKWTTSYTLDTRVGLLSMGRMGSVLTMISSQTYWLFDDGSAKLVAVTNGKEMSWTGTWSYGDGILKIVGTGSDGKSFESDFNVLWIDLQRFELRFANLEQYRKMLQVDNVESTRCRYEPNGVLHSQMIIKSKSMGQTQESVVVMVQGPQIYHREGDAE